MKLKICVLVLSAHLLLCMEESNRLHLHLPSPQEGMSSARYPGEEHQNQDVVINFDEYDKNIGQPEQCLIDPTHLSQEAKNSLKRLGLCEEDVFGNLRVRSTRLDFDQIVNVVKSVAELLSDMQSLRDLVLGNKKQADEEVASTKKALEEEQAASKARWIKAGIAGIIGAVTTLTPSIVAIIKASQNN